jgi:hypothetical protein
MIVIKDGKSGNVAEVSKSGKLMVESVQRPKIEEQAEAGRAFWFASDFIALTTTGSFSGIFYLKNTHETEILYLQFLRTCGVAIQEWRFISNPTAGTLISAGTNIIPQNANLGSNRTFSGVVTAGADSKTITDGSDAGQWINNVGHSIQELAGTVIVPPTKSFAMTCKPAAAGDVCVTMMGWQA